MSVLSVAGDSSQRSIATEASIKGNLVRVYTLQYMTGPLCIVEPFKVSQVPPAGSVLGFPDFMWHILAVDRQVLTVPLILACIGQAATLLQRSLVLVEYGICIVAFGF